MIRDVLVPFVRSRKNIRERCTDVANQTVYLYHFHRWRWNLAAQLGDVSAIPITRPIFFLGVQGGGLTILSRVLRRHPKVVSITGDSSYWTGQDEMQVEYYRMHRLPKTLWGCKHRHDLRHPAYGTKHVWLYASDALLPHYRRTENDATPETRDALRRLIRQTLAVYSRVPASVQFFDKSQTNTVRIPLINALLSDCNPRFVLVLRSPYSMCVRAVRKEYPALLSLPYEDKLRAVAEHWANSFGIALKDGEHLPNMLVVRFEDFVEQPEQTTQQICDFVGLEYDPEMLPQPHHRLPWGTWPGDDKWYPLRNDGWQAAMTDRDVAIINERCQALAERFGYRPQTTQ